LKGVAIVSIALSFFIAGCITSSKAVKPATCASEEKYIASEEKIPSQACPIPTEGFVAVGSEKSIEPDAVSDGPITYSQIIDVIDVFFDVQSGDARFLGPSDNGLMNLEMVGQKDEISQASLKLSYPKDITRSDSDLNNAVMLRFLKNIAPQYKEWPSDVRAMIDKFSTMQIGKKEKNKITLGHKIIQILYDKKIDTITLTVRIR